MSFCFLCKIQWNISSKNEPRTQIPLYNNNTNNNINNNKNINNNDIQEDKISYNQSTIFKVAITICFESYVFQAKDFFLNLPSSYQQSVYLHVKRPIRSSINAHPNIEIGFSLEKNSPINIAELHYILGRRRRSDSAGSALFSFSFFI